MKPYSTRSYAQVQTYPAPDYRLLQVALAVMGGIGLFLILTLFFVTSYGKSSDGTIYLGVSVGGVDISGMHPSEAAALLAERLDYPSRGNIGFQEGGNIWAAKPNQLGLFVDSQSSALAAYQIGRQGDLFQRFAEQLQARNSGINLPPLLVYDERIAQNYLMQIAAQIDKPVVEASLAVNGVDVVVSPGQVGRTVDIAAALAKLEEQLYSQLDGIIPLVVRETPPVILDATAQAEIARRILSAPLVLQIPNPEEGDPGPWTFEPNELADMLIIERTETHQGATYQVALNSESLRPFLEEQAPKLQRYPQNARFIFNDDTDQLEVIEESIIGRSLNVDETIALINQKVVEGEHTLAIDIDFTSPEVPSSATGEQLGVRQMVSSHTSYFYGSSSERIQNIQIASARFHGVLVPPGAVFSMVEVLGDVSLDNGYAEALIIVGDRTIQGVGGGVCQVSTTLFRTAFLGGLPIVERYPHAYRVGYYEQTPGGGHDANLAGMDATVFVPVVDFKFTNDSPYWLLMETYVNTSARSLTWKFYSTSDGRTVEWDTSGPTNIIDPPDPLYEENPDLQEGEIKQIDYSAKGADVTVRRTVWKDGLVLYADTFTTHYLPWRAIYQYGPGTDIPDQNEEDDA